MKKFYILLGLIFICNSIFSQEGDIHGVVTTNDETVTIPKIQVKLIGPFYEKTTYTDDEGVYHFTNAPAGAYTVVVSEESFFEVSAAVDYIAGETIEVEPLVLERLPNANDASNDVPVFDNSDDGDISSTGGNAIASLINSSRDVFAFNASMSWFAGRFNFRGSRNQDQMFYFNGIPLRDITNGNQVTYADYTGMNDVMRNRSNYYGVKAVPFSFGEMNNTVNIEAEAMNQRKGFRISQFFSNRTFLSRTSVTYSTGLLKNNFAFTVSGSFRGANTGYIEGTGSQVFSGYMSLTKKWSSVINTSLSFLASDNTRELSKGSTKEFYQLAGTNFYNPNWGYYQGDKRSISIRRDNAPIVFLSNKINISNKTKLNFYLGYQFGQRYRKRIDWYKSYSPDPSYYRNAPSYFIDNPVVYNEMLETYHNNPEMLQVNWNRLYDANSNVEETVPNQGVTGKWARYMLYKDMNKISQFSFNANIKHILSDKVAIDGGVTTQINTTHQYKEMDDLLGADFFVNVNQFAQRNNPTDPDAIQNDLNNPFQIIKVGDKYGYNYKMHVTDVNVWGQTEVNLNRLDLFLALQVENVSYKRDGLFRNGAYKDNSYGKSPSKSFTNFSVKGGFTFKFDGKNYFSLNAMRTEAAPLFNQVFVLPRTTNIIAEDVKKRSLVASEVSYNYRGPRLKFSITGFYNLSQNETDVKNFYTELANSFGALVMKNMNKQFMGIEGAIDAKIGNSGFNIMNVMNLGDYTYKNRPVYTFYYDNFYQINPEETVYFKNLHLATGPQITNTFKVSYFSKQYWIISLAGNYFDKIYVEPSQQRRTLNAVDNLDPNSELYKNILTQERVPGAFTIDFFFRKSFLVNKYLPRLKSRMFFDINLSVNNLLNNTNFIASGYEQLRFDFADRNPEKYPNRYYYAFGTNFALNLVFRL